MFCKHCGKEIPEKSKFCRFCGKSLFFKDKETINNKEPEKSTKHIKEKEYAGFWIRLGAYCIDYSIIFFLTIVILMFIESDWSENAYGLFLTVGYVLYSIFFLSTWSTTPGKSILKLSVFDEKNNSHLSGSEATKRSILQIFSTFLFGIGYWNMGKNEKKQTFHDKSAGTVVIQEEKPGTLRYIVAAISIIFIVGLILYGYS